MIQLISTRQEWLSIRRQISGSLGLVPTMGNLHQGHLSLIERALQENDHILVTIFVNPKQFGPNEDFERYPRTLEKDIDLIKSLERKKDQKVFVFAPSSMTEVYPENFSSVIQVKGLTEKLCGLTRPGHFDGVTTVVYQLFQLAQAQQAYFGQKDFQQFKVIEKMVKDLALPVTVHCCPIVRDDQGLALSSRNQYLTNEQKEVALILSRHLRLIASSLKEKKNTGPLIAEMLEKSDTQLTWEYLEILDAHNLEELNKSTETAVVLGALKVGSTRLIDNLLVPLNGEYIVR